MSTNLQALKPFLGPINRPASATTDATWQELERQVAALEAELPQIAAKIAQRRFDLEYPPGHPERDERNPFAALRVDGVPPPSPTSNPSPKGPTSDHSGAATKPKDE